MFAQLLQIEKKLNNNQFRVCLWAFWFYYTTAELEIISIIQANVP